MSFYRLRPLSRSAGFTLVEMVIALALFSMILLGLVGALKTFGDTLTRADGKTRETESVRLVSAFLRETIRTAAPLLDGASSGRKDAALLFEGHAEGMSWVGAMPARHGAGGLHRFRLVLDERADGRRDLVIEFAPYEGYAGVGRISEFARRGLAQDVLGLRLRFQADDDEAWIDEWSDVEQLPARVSLKIETSHALWPEIVIALHSAGATGVRNWVGG